MGSHSNFKQEKCWSCAFYTGKQRISRFLTPSIMSEDYGTCTCAKCPKNGQKVRESDWCNKWQIHGLVSQLKSEEIAKKQEAQARAESARASQEIERQQRELEREREYECREIERERRKLEEERQKLEYERWYSSLTLEERKAEDDRKAEEARQAKIAEEKRRREIEEEYERREQERIQREAIEKERKKKRTKGLLIAFGSVVGVIAIVIASVSISNAIKANQTEKAYKQSDTYKLIDYIDKNGSNNYISFVVDREEGCKATFVLEYQKAGWTDNWSEKRDFRAYTILTPRTEDHYKETIGFCFFNLDGSDNGSNYLNGNGACFTGKTTYGTNSVVITQYQQTSYNKSKDEISYAHCYWNYDNWNNTYNEYRDEWTERSFKACDLTNLAVEILFKDATGHDFWR